MKNWTFKQWNTVLGWIIFGIAFLTYLSTIEPNFSFWDTGEYIASAVKLEVTHAPGAALFQLVGAVAGIFAFGNGENFKSLKIYAGLKTDIVVDGEDYQLILQKNNTNDFEITLS